MLGHATNPLPGIQLLRVWSDNLRIGVRPWSLLSLFPLLLRSFWFKIWIHSSLIDFLGCLPLYSISWSDCKAFSSHTAMFYTNHGNFANRAERADSCLNNQTWSVSELDRDSASCLDPLGVVSPFRGRLTLGFPAKEGSIPSTYWRQQR